MNYLALLLALLGLGGSPSLAWSPTTDTGTYAYGTVDSGSTKDQTFTLTNSGTGASSTLTVTLDGSSAFAITGNTCTGKSVGAKKSCTVTVRYAPTTAGSSDTATLAATYKNATAATTITLTGSSPVARSVSISFRPYRPGQCYVVLSGKGFAPSTSYTARVTFATRTVNGSVNNGVHTDATGSFTDSDLAADSGSGTVYATVDGVRSPTESIVC